MPASAPKAQSTPAIQEVASAPKKPFSIKVGEPCHTAMNIAVHLARQGYCFSEAPIEFTPTGHVFFEMIIADPLAFVINKANDAIELSAAQEEQARQREIKEEARRLVEAEKREVLAKQVAELKENQARQLAALEASTAAAIAALSK